MSRNIASLLGCTLIVVACGGVDELAQPDAVQVVADVQDVAQDQSGDVSDLMVDATGETASDGATDVSDPVPDLTDVTPDVLDTGDVNADLSGLDPDVEEVQWGDVIEAPANEWTWIDFPETKCADGTPTGLGVSLSPGATMAFVYLEGGGACWNYQNCFGLIQTSLHLNGYSEQNFDGIVAGAYLSSLLFDRADLKNPFRDAHHVFVPYCTGDVFSGDREVELQGLLPWEKQTIHFHGAKNLDAYLNRLIPTFESVEKVVVSGSSAGGYGAGISWPRIQAAFGSVRVDLLDDSGPPVPPAGDLWDELVEAWNMQFPDDCLDCALGMSQVIDYFRSGILQNSRMAIMSYDHDPIISTFLGMSWSDFNTQLLDLCAIFDEEPNAHYFVVPGVFHTLILGPGYKEIESSDGMPLWRWVEKFANDEPDWSSHQP
jgi:hypothetical protein